MYITYTILDKHVSDTRQYSVYLLYPDVSDLLDPDPLVRSTDPDTVTSL